MRTFICLVVGIIIFSSEVMALKVTTHYSLNKKVVSSAFGGFDLHAYLSNNLGENDGVISKYGGSDVLEIIGFGGKYEDDPKPGILFSEYYYTRYTNHFHNPLMPFWQAGYDVPPLKGYSAIRWSQYPAGEQKRGGNYSWRDARRYIYEALTSIDPAVREQRFADTFRALGQVMHLVQDMSAPAHTRNDFHNVYNYENRLRLWESESEMAEWIAAGKDHLFPMEELNQPSSFPYDASVPIARLFDGNHYDGSNPSVTLQSNIGLAEFTHANFVSADTLPVKDTGDTPNLKESCIATTYREVPKMFHLDGYSYVERPYYSRTLGCEMVQGTAEEQAKMSYLLAGVDFFTFVIGDPDFAFPESQMITIPPMDNNVYDDYARHLVPRAVGYSSTLLHYFFRGDFDVQGHEVPDPAGNPIALQFTVKNTTSYEDISTGKFTIMYEYLPEHSDVPVRGYSYDVESGELTSEGPAGTYIASFTSTIPATAREVRYQLVFRGVLGYENDTVAVSMVDVLRPVFKEEWSSGLNGANAWLHTGTDLPGPQEASGAVSNATDSAFLYKENTRHAGIMSGQVNESVYEPSQPILISADAKVGLKIDSMQIEPILAPQTCANNPWNLPAYQKVGFEFLLGDGTRRSYHYSVDGQYDFGNRVIINEHYHWFDNIYWVLEQLGPVVEPVRLQRIKLVQNLMPLCNEMTSPQTQTMDVDYIRVVDKLN